MIADSDFFQRMLGRAPTTIADPALVRLIRGPYALRLPLLSSISAVVLAHVLAQAGVLAWWVPTAVAAVTLLWGLLMWRSVQRHWPGATSLDDLLGQARDVLAIPVSARRWGTVAAALLMLPGWAGALAWTCALVLVFAQRIDAARPLLERRPRRLISWVLAALFGLALLALASPLLGPDTNATVSALLGGLLAILWVVAAPRPARRSWGLLLGPAAAWLAPGILLVSTGGSLVGLTLASLGWPAIQWLAFRITFPNIPLDRLQEVTNKQKEPSQLLGFEPLVRQDEAIRAHDGLVARCSPAYRHLLATRAGETGYVTWVGHPDDEVMPQIGESILIRQTGAANDALSETPDPCGVQLRSLLTGLLPTGLIRRHSDRFQALGSILEDFLEPTDVRLCRPGRPIPLTKMTWEAPGFVVIPSDWTGSLVLPPGASIYDASHWMAHVPRARIRIRIREDVLNAVRSCEELGARAPEEARLRVRQLLWNAPRLLAGVYQTTLTELQRWFRDHPPIAFGVADSQEDADAARDAAREGLSDRIVARLPDPLGELIAVDLLSFNEDRLSGEDLRTRYRTLDSMERTEARSLHEQIERLQQRIRSEFFGTWNESIRTEIESAREAFRHHSDAAIATVRKALSEVDAEGLIGDVRRAQDAIRADRVHFDKQSNAACNTVLQSVNDLYDAFQRQA